MTYLSFVLDAAQTDPKWIPALTGKQSDLLAKLFEQYICHREPMLTQEYLENPARFDMVKEAPSLETSGKHTLERVKPAVRYPKSKTVEEEAMALNKLYDFELGKERDTLLGPKLFERAVRGKTPLWARGMDERPLEPKEDEALAM